MGCESQDREMLAWMNGMYSVACCLRQNNKTLCRRDELPQTEEGRDFIVRKHQAQVSPVILMVCGTTH